MAEIKITGTIVTGPDTLSESGTGVHTVQKFFQFLPDDPVPQRMDSFRSRGIGQQMTVNGKKYKVIEKYPYIIRLQAKDGKTITLNKADLVTARGNAVSNSNGKGKAIKCLTDGKKYDSVRVLAKELGYTCYSQLVEKINNIELIDGKLYRWV